MMTLASMSAQPWWAIPVMGGAFGLGGTLVGAAIAFVSTRSETSRQIRREERNSRRTVYAQYIERAARLYERCSDLESAGVELDTLNQNMPQVLLPNSEKIALDLKRRFENLSSRVEKLGREVLSREEEVSFCYYEVTLYAPPPVRTQAGTALAELAKLAAVSANRECAGNERDVARKKARRAITDFTVIARADVRSPGARPLGSATRRLKKMQERDAIEEALIEGVTASVEDRSISAPEQLPPTSELRSSGQ